MTDDTAAVIARYKYDAWGNRVPTAGDPTATHHGFTGHEQLDDVGLVNMNGRIYDPVLGRFMSADPYIQAPDNLQSYNRYSYVWNNPLSSADPSGYWNLRKWFSATTKAIFFPTPKNSFEGIRNQPGQQYVDKFVMTHQWAYVVGQVATTYFTFICGGCGGAAYSAYYTYLATGSATKGVITGVKEWAISYATQYMDTSISNYYGDTWNWGRVAANGVAGGITSRLNGGSFEDGFKNAFILSTFTYANFSMRQEMIASSQLDPSNASGNSGGFFHDHFKLGGARRWYDENAGEWKCESPLGGCQGGMGTLFGHVYSSGGVIDRAVEAYAGPHDWLNSGYWYDKLGDGINRTGFANFVGQGLNTLNVAVATPFAVAGLVTTTPVLLSAVQQNKRIPQ